MTKCKAHGVHSRQNLFLRSKQVYYFWCIPFIPRLNRKSSWRSFDLFSSSFRIRRLSHALLLVVFLIICHSNQDICLNSGPHLTCSLQNNVLYSCSMNYNDSPFLLAWKESFLTILSIKGVTVDWGRRLESELILSTANLKTTSCWPSSNAKSPPILRFEGMDWTRRRRDRRTVNESILNCVLLISFCRRLLSFRPNSCELLSVSHAQSLVSIETDEEGCCVGSTEDGQKLVFFLWLTLRSQVIKMLWNQRIRSCNVLQRNGQFSYCRVVHEL